MKDRVKQSWDDRGPGQLPWRWYCQLLWPFQALEKAESIIPHVVTKAD